MKGHIIAWFITVWGLGMPLENLNVRELFGHM